jgi:hypothetical protein
MVTYNRLQATPGSFIVIIFLKILNSNLFYIPPSEDIFLSLCYSRHPAAFLLRPIIFSLQKYFISASISQGLIF